MYLDYEGMSGLNVIKQKAFCKPWICCQSLIISYNQIGDSRLKSIEQFVRFQLVDLLLAIVIRKQIYDYKC